MNNVSIYIIVFVGIFLISFLLEKLIEGYFLIRFRNPGYFVKVNKRKLHFVRKGEGESAIILISGIGGTSLEWNEVQNKLSKISDVISFDRPGYGWSESTYKNRSIENLSQELRELIVKLKIFPPYILIGHSLGGLIARYYTNNFSSEVGGLILLDPMHEDELTDRFPKENKFLWNKSLNSNRIISLLSFFGIPGFLNKSKFLPVEFRKSLTKLPDKIRKNITAFYLNSISMKTLVREMKAMKKSYDQIRNTGSLGKIPLVVIKHGINDSRFNNLTKEKKERIESLFNEVQLETSKLSDNGKLITADKSGHYIHIDQPDLVVETAKNIIEEIK